MKHIQLFEIPILCFFFVLLDSSSGYAEAPNAFIFSLNNSEGLAPFVSKVKPEWRGRAIQRHSFYGPKFGDDLVIIYLNDKTFSKADLGVVYSVPASVNDKGSTILKGPGQYFSPEKVEVFYLDPSRSMQHNTN